MPEETTFVAHLRPQGQRKGARNAIRKQGGLLAGLSKKDATGAGIWLDKTLAEKWLSDPKARSSIVTLQVEGRAIPAVVKEVQIDPVTRKVHYIDFEEVAFDRPVEVEVPVAVTGRPRGEVAGGILQVQTRAVRVRALPQNIPAELTVDISPLEIGDTLHSGDIPLPPTVELVSDPEEVLVTILAPRRGAAEGEAEAEEAEQQA